MAFWSGETLSQRLDREKLVSDFHDDRIDCSAYTLRVGSEAFITPDHELPSPFRHTTSFLKEGEGIAIPPGQFGFLVTEETIRIPSDAMAFISMKATTKFQGLINVSGFHVDPGYEGKLIFSVFNAGPNSVHVQRGMPLFLIWFACLDEPTKRRKKKSTCGQMSINTIQPKLLNGISGKIHSAHSVSETITALEKEVSHLKGHVYVIAPIVGAICAMGIFAAMQFGFKNFFQP